jgi:hypothetical protein
MEMSASRPTMTFTFLELLDRTFRIYRENFATLIGLVALVTIPLSIINLVLTLPSLSTMTDFATFGRPADTSQLTSTVCLSTLLSLVIGLLQFVLNNAPITYITSESQMGRKVSMGEAFRATRPRFSSLAFGVILFGLVIVAASLFLGLISALCAIAFAAFGIVVYIGIATYSFLVPVLVLENVGASFGINRSWSLGKARFWMVVAVSTSITVLTFIIALAFSAAGLWLVYQIIPPTTPFVTRQLIESALSTFISLFTVPLLPIALTLLYYDTRTRLEGLDIALQALGNPDARPWDVVSPGGGAGLNSKDWVNIIILTVGAVAITVVLGATLISLLQPFMPPTGRF